MKRPDRFPRNFSRLTFLSAHGLGWTCVMLKPVRSGLAGVVARAVVEPGRDIESLFESALSPSFPANGGL